MIIDLHTHTSVGSYDSNVPINELIARSKKAGIDGVVFTEHDRFWDPEQVEKTARDYNFPCFGGAEVDTEEGHILVFGIKEYKFGMHHASKIREFADQLGGFMILSHPYRRWFYYGNDIPGTVERVWQHPVFKIVDTVETMNGRGNERQTGFSIELGNRLGWQGTGGSDAHMLHEVATCATEFEKNNRSVEELVQELKAGRYRPVDVRKK